MAWLKDAITGVDFSNLKGLVLVDLWGHVGDLANVFCKLRGKFSVSMFLKLFVSSQVEADYLLDSLEEDLANLITNEQVLPPSGVKIPKAINEDLLDPMPPKPSLNSLVIDSDGRLGIPIALVRAWQLHPSHGAEFSKWLDTFTEKHRIIDPSIDPPPPGTKRLGTETNEEPEPKKPKTQMPKELIVAVGTIDKPLLCEAKIAPLPGCPAAFVQIRASPWARQDLVLTLKG